MRLRRGCARRLRLLILGRLWRRRFVGLIMVRGMSPREVDVVYLVVFHIYSVTRRHDGGGIGMRKWNGKGSLAFSIGQIKKYIVIDRRKRFAYPFIHFRCHYILLCCSFEGYCSLHRVPHPNRIPHLKSPSSLSTLSILGGRILFPMFSKPFLAF